eukprot:Hpha_TRINITY_DN14446_c0_g3::TRINITY_DN14446_c0_g3_i1::g.157473::m.157473/K01522/FHIT; bis(5'-adenosyl)-triphosphatase
MDKLRAGLCGWRWVVVGGTGALIVMRACGWPAAKGRRQYSARADFRLGPADIPSACVLPSGCATSVAFAGVSPVRPGHAVVATAQPRERVRNLTDTEWLDLWRCVRVAQGWSEKQQSAEASNLLLKDGEAAGAPFPHLHAHILPRTPGDFPRGDTVFDALQRWVPSPDITPRERAFWVPSDSDRRDRTPAEMAAEAASYRDDETPTPDRGQTSAPEQEIAVSETPDQGFKFSRFPIRGDSIFMVSRLSCAFVNLRPLAPGHVLVVPQRCVPRLRDLSAEEYDDLWLLVRRVGEVVTKVHRASGAEFGVQDGNGSGQSVPHAHVHIVPFGASKL